MSGDFPDDFPHDKPCPCRVCAYFGQENQEQRSGEDRRKVDQRIRRGFERADAIVERRFTDRRQSDEERDAEAERYYEMHYRAK